MIFPSDERLDVFLRVERLEIVDALAEANKLHGHAQLLRDSDADAALGRAVELREHDAGEIRRVEKLLGLNETVLTGRGIEHHERFNVGLRQLAADDALPVKYVGVGEQIDDLLEFKPAEFVEALLS